MENEVKVNMEEYEKQKNESIINSGHYCRSEIIVGRKDFAPIITTKIQGVTPFEIAVLIKALEIQIDTLKKQYPKAEYIYKKHITVEREIHVTKDIDNKNNENN